MATITQDADLVITGKITQTGTPSASGDVITKGYADLNYSGGGGTGLKLSELAVLSATQIASGDKVSLLDISDPTMAVSGTNKTSEVGELIKRFGPVVNTSVANQTGFAADTYLTGSNVLIPAGRLQAKSIYRCKFNVSKTAAGTATPIIQVRIGTAGTTADTSRASLTFPAQTAAIDDGFFDVVVVFRTVGSGTTAVIQATVNLVHRNSIIGLANLTSPTVTATSAGFDSTVASLQIGISVNGGTSAAWTVNSVVAELSNLL